MRGAMSKLEELTGTELARLNVELAEANTRIAQLERYAGLLEKGIDAHSAREEVWGHE